MLLSAWDLVKASWNLYTKNFKTFITYSVMATLPVFVAILLTGGAVFFASGLEAFKPGEAVLFGGIAGVMALFVFAGLVSFWFSLAVIRVIGKSYENVPLKSMREELGDAAPLMWPGILASLLAGLAIIGGFILLIIPGIIFSLWFGFVLAAVSLDNIRGVEALRASKRLVQGRWWAVLWRLLVPMAMAFLVSWAINLPLGIMGEVTESTAFGAATIIVSGLVSILITPFMTGAQTILYLELKKHPVASSEPEPNASTPNEPPV